MPTLPSSLTAITSLLRRVFTVPTAETFESLLAGFIATIGEHTVCGMWQGAGLASDFHHSRAHGFFSRARWSHEELGLRLLGILVNLFVPDGEPILIAVDGSLFRRSGPKVFGARWHYDSSVGPSGGLRFGNCFVVAGLMVKIPALGKRTWCLPVLARLWVPPPKGATKAERRDHPSQQMIAGELISLIAKRFPKRRIHAVGDCAFACKAMAPTDSNVTMTARLKANAVIHGPKPPPTGRPGRPRVMGKRLGNPAEIVAAAKPGDWEAVEVEGRGVVQVLVVRGLWYSAFGPTPIKEVIICEPGEGDGKTRYFALITTDIDASAAEIIARYADRWSIEVAFQDAKQLTGVGEARSRSPKAVERTVPFGLICQSIAVAWYALNADPAADVQRRRQAAPWYKSKRDPSMADILAALRREMIRVEYSAGTGEGPRLGEIPGVQRGCGVRAA